MHWVFTDKWVVRHLRALCQVACIQSYFAPLTPLLSAFVDETGSVTDWPCFVSPPSGVYCGELSIIDFGVGNAPRFGIGAPCSFSLDGSFLTASGSLAVPLDFCCISSSLILQVAHVVESTACGAVSGYVGPRSLQSSDPARRPGYSPGRTEAVERSIYGGLALAHHGSIDSSTLCDPAHPTGAGRIF